MSELNELHRKLDIVSYTNNYYSDPTDPSSPSSHSHPLPPSHPHPHPHPHPLSHQSYPHHYEPDLQRADFEDLESLEFANLHSKAVTSMLEGGRSDNVKEEMQNTKQNDEIMELVLEVQQLSLQLHLLKPSDAGWEMTKQKLEFVQTKLKNKKL